VDHPLAVDAQSRRCSVHVVFQNVFVSFFDGQKVSGTSAMEVASDGHFFVISLDVTRNVFKHLFAVETLFISLVNFDDVFEFVFLCSKIKSTIFVVLALNYFSLVMYFYVLAKTTNWIQHFSLTAVNAFVFFVGNCVVQIFVFLGWERNLTLRAIENIQGGNFHRAGANQVIWNQILIEEW